jgi:hypothetical protein
MTYEQWLEINVPDWRNYRCNGFNDPHEGWHYRYTEYVNTPKPLTPPDALIDETVNFVKETIQGLEDCSINIFCIPIVPSFMWIVKSVTAVVSPIWYVDFQPLFVSHLFPFFNVTQQHTYQL